jgi:putative endonuclease
MHYVYLLRSSKDDGFYIGCSESIAMRFEEHRQGKVESTKHRRPLELVYYEAYTEKGVAQERERKLKQFGSSYTGLLKRLGYK